MYQTDNDYAFFRAGRCYGIASIMAGPGAAMWNADTLASFRKADEVRELPRADAVETHKVYLRTLPDFAGVA